MGRDFLYGRAWLFFNPPTPPSPSTSKIDGGVLIMIADVAFLKTKQYLYSSYSVKEV